MGPESTRSAAARFFSSGAGAQLARACSAVRAGLISLVSACSGARHCPKPLWNTPSFIIDRSQESSGGRGPLRALAPRSRRWPSNLSRAPGLSEEPVALLRRFPLSFLGDRWRGDIDFGSASSCRGPAADEPSPCEVRKWRHWKKSGQCQASAHSLAALRRSPTSHANRSLLNVRL